MIALWLLLAQLSVEPLAAVAEPWRVLVEVEATSGAETPVAVAVNREGFRLAVMSSPRDPGALCTLHLPEDISAALAPDEPPTVEIDAWPPQRVGRWRPSDHWQDGGDFLEGLRRELGLVPRLDLGADRVAFQCWRPLPRQASPTRGVLRQLLDGRQLIARLTLEDGEHRETTFSLAGARQAIGEALEIPLEPSRRDLLQDELLAFRIDYRKTTCYLLKGKRRQKRCLEAVERCRSEDHESVVSMLGCIEGE